MGCRVDAGAKVDIQIEDEEESITLVLLRTFPALPPWNTTPLWRPLEDHHRHRRSPVITKILVCLFSMIFVYCCLDVVGR